jgi:hypothetical protein
MNVAVAGSANAQTKSPKRLSEAQIQEICSKRVAMETGMTRNMKMEACLRAVREKQAR